LRTIIICNNPEQIVNNCSYAMIYCINYLMISMV